MFQISNYQCKDCKHIQEHLKKNILENFPKEIKCEKCGSISERVYGIGGIEIPAGKLGNGKNGYETQFTPFHGLGWKLKGTKI